MTQGVEHLRQVPRTKSLPEERDLSNDTGGLKEQRLLLQDIVEAVKKVSDEPVRKIVRGPYLVGVMGNRMGLCSRSRANRDGQSDHSWDYLCGKSIRDLASLLLDSSSGFLDLSSLALAAVNALLPLPESMVSVKAQDLLRRVGNGKNVAVVGHFPFVEKIGREFRNLWVLERNPKPGDFPADLACELLPRAEVVAMTATTLINGTCADLLKLIPRNAFTIILGPSTPFAPCLFDWGIDVLAGCHVQDPQAVADDIRGGKPFRKMTGVRYLVWTARSEPSC